MVSILKEHPLLKIINGSLRDLPSPSSIHFMWNFGSLLGLCLVLQLLTGLFLAMHYSADVGISFSSVSHINRDVNMGWMLRMAHANGASMFFICLYSHLYRGLYFGSFRWMEVWNVGVLILVLVMAAAFLGYVLPWGQMSFWGATVITNLFSALPYIGGDLVFWLWGGFAVDNATLTRFFAFHFLVPFIIAGASMVHLLFLHQKGSSNPLGLSINSDKTPFHPYFTVKDLVGILMFMLFFVVLLTQGPWVLGDPENFIAANPLVTPVHIQPEWYFLFAYAILRSIPSKLGGVSALGLSVLIFFVLPFMPAPRMQGVAFYPVSKLLLLFFVVVVGLLTWIGARPVEEPYILIGQLLTVAYFFFFVAYTTSMCGMDHMLNFHSK